MSTNMNVSMRYSTHLPVLMEAVRRTTGDVLELGPGVFSTPVLHWMTESQHRNLLTVESDKGWLRFCKRNYPEGLHKFLLVANWDDAKNSISKNWDVVLVDHSPAERRVKEIEILAPFAKYIVVHDADDGRDKYFHLSKIRHLFKYYWRLENIEPQVAVYSNFVDLKDFSIYV